MWTVAVLGVIGAIAGGGNKTKNEQSVPTSRALATVAPTTPILTTQAPAATAPLATIAPPQTTAVPATTTPPATTAARPPTTVSEQAGIGSVVELDGGTLAPLNSFTANVTPLSEFFLPEPGTTFSRIAVEVCAGSSGFSANPLYFRGFLDDNTSADSALGSKDFQTFGVAPGGCTGGTIDFQVPDGRTLTSVVVTGALFDEQGRWSTAGTETVSAPLAAPVPPIAPALGVLITLDDGATAVVRSVTPNATPPNQFVEVPAGHQLVKIDVEQCAGSEPLSVNPLYWLLTTTDNYTAGAALGAQTLDSLEVAAGQCIAGTVAFIIPSTSTAAYAILVPVFGEESGRWKTV